jgi:FlaA1/EpsC-like NDP-sugar epimerase
VVIVGAGDAGMMLLKELALNSESPCLPVAVVDDDAEKWGRTIHGVPVVGGTDDLARLAAAKCAEEILICIPSASRSQMRNILGACRKAEIPVRTLPTLAGLVDCRVSLRDLRNPRVEDLLQREEIRVDIEEARKIVAGKTVLVTGAGGSIGSELCRQIASAGGCKLLLLEKSENSLFYVNLEATERLGTGCVKPLLADLVDKGRVREILRNERPDIIFHAAAHKHVGLLELHPLEAIRNNVLGTRNIGEAAIESGVGSFINISTDKAVHPRSYMGLSKKLTELCIQELAGVNGTRFMNVRFGNVAGSTGSVLRIFWDQIQKGGPIRVSDRRATRYFMSVPEAVHLILRAAALGKGGETFVFDMGEPLNIYELAKTMTLFAGMKPGRDLQIEFIGLKEGEKVSEELWEDWERPIPTETARILVTAERNPLSRGILEKVKRMEDYVARHDRDGLLKYIHEVVPHFPVNRASTSTQEIAPEKGRATADWSVGAA